MARTPSSRTHRVPRAVPIRRAGMAFGGRGGGHARRMRILLVSLLIAAAIYLASGGHVLFLPLLLFLPLGLFGSRRRRGRR
jgi:hypothetical protein